MSDQTDERGALERYKYTLPIGFQVQGVHVKSFELGPIKGKLRRELLNTSNPHRMTMIALKHVVTKLGPFDYPAASMFGRIPGPDVDYINLVLTERECGPALEISGTCGTEEFGPEGCGADIKDSVDLPNVGMKEASCPILFGKNGEPYQEMTFTDPVAGKEISIKYRLPSLQDQENLWETMATMVADQQGKKKTKRPKVEMGDFVWHQMSTLMLDYDGRGRGLSVAEMDDLDIRTLDAMVAEIKDRIPLQLDSEILVTCGTCMREHSILLEVDRWMTPFGKPVPSGS